jgi:dTMP kinase
VSGLFITLEGGEGTGKSTQIARLAAEFSSRGLIVTSLREPGGTPLGDRVREILLDPAMAGMSHWAEVFLYEASRAELVDAVILPALDRGEVVLCDRFTDSTLAYQGFARGLDLDALRALNERATHGLEPDVTVLIDVEPSVGLGRATAQGPADRLEAEGFAFHEAVRAGFLVLAAEEPGRFVVADGSGSPDEVAAEVWSEVSQRPKISSVLHGAAG